MRRVIHIGIESEHLTPAQAQHVEALATEFVSAMSDKYIRGQREHGGDLFNKSIDFLLDAAIEECYDQYVYLKTLKERLNVLVTARTRGYDLNDPKTPTTTVEPV